MISSKFEDRLRSKSCILPIQPNPHLTFKKANTKNIEQKQSAFPKELQSRRTDANRTAAAMRPRTAPILNRTLQPSATNRTTEANVTDHNTQQRKYTELMKLKSELEDCSSIGLQCHQELILFEKPKSKWYEMKTPEFHIEARRHYQSLNGPIRWQSMMEQSLILLETIELKHKRITSD